MGVRTRIAAAGLAAGLPLLSWGEPAAAETFVEFSDAVTFRRGGQELTCTVGGNSSVAFISGFSQMSVNSFLTDDDPACRDALSHIVALGSYRLEQDGRSDSFFASAAAPQVLAHADVEGAVVSVDGQHIFFFDCDDPRGHPCSSTFATKPK